MADAGAQMLWNCLGDPDPGGTADPEEEGVSAEAIEVEKRGRAHVKLAIEVGTKYAYESWGLR